MILNCLNVEIKDKKKSKQKSWIKSSGVKYFVPFSPKIDLEVFMIAGSIYIEFKLKTKSSNQDHKPYLFHVGGRGEELENNLYTGVQPKNC